LNHLNKAPAAINPDKLIWLNQHYLKTDDVKKIAELLAKECQRLNIPSDTGPDLTDVVRLQRERVKTLNEMAEKSRYFYLSPTIEKQTLSADRLVLLKILRDRFQSLSVWTDESIHSVLIETGAELSLKMGKVAQPLRYVVTGGSVSPPINATLRVLGKQEVLVRLDRVLN
ncbi:MAG: glutamyl-tRNA synthetase, partial [Pseudomonadota bacterium]|nr:glutamyl-tRNA synthetase [Pseudomonadota bacterium]